jgi:hypothetical protein
MSSLGEKFTRSWQLFASSCQIIGRQPKLLLFPLVAFSCTVLIVLFFLAPVALLPTGHSWSEAAHWQAAGQRLVEKRPADYVPGQLDRTMLDLDHLSVDSQRTKPQTASRVQLTTTAYVYLVALYLTSMFVATFFNVAFYNEIIKALAGDAVSIGAGLRFACSRLRAILLWSLFAGAVGLIIKTLEERFGWIGRWVMRFIGVVWSVASIFVIPLIVREENANPFTLLRTSATTLKKTWGESLIGYVGITLGAWVAVLASVIFLIGTILLSVWLHHPMYIFVASGLWILAMFVYGYLVSVAGHIYRGALYVYASEGVVPEPFTAELMDAAWKVKKT